MHPDSIRKYPRTRHLAGSRHGQGDDLEDVDFASIADTYLVVEEKMDGANAAISFTADRELLLQSRGHYLDGGPRERHFAGLKAWAVAHQHVLWAALGDRFICYGEWCYAKHTVFYDRLPHHFLEFDVLDTTSSTFLSTEARSALLAHTPVVSVPVLAHGSFSTSAELTGLVAPSLYKSSSWPANLRVAAGVAGADVEMTVAQTDPSPLAEGLYVKQERNGIVVDRFKWVRSEFLQTLAASDSHWQSRPIVANGLAPGVEIYDPTPSRRPLPERRS